MQCEFEPITSGHRLCLVYDLIQPPQQDVARIKVPSPGWPRTYHRLHEALDRWSDAKNAPQKLIHPLNNYWTTELLSPSRFWKYSLPDLDALQQFTTRQRQLPGAITQMLTSTCVRFPKEVLNLVFEYAPVAAGVCLCLVPHFARSPSTLCSNSYVSCQVSSGAWACSKEKCPVISNVKKSISRGTTRQPK